MKKLFTLILILFSQGCAVTFQIQSNQTEEELVGTKKETAQVTKKPFHLTDPQKILINASQYVPREEGNSLVEHILKALACADQDTDSLSDFCKEIAHAAVKLQTIEIMEEARNTEGINPA